MWNFFLRAVDILALMLLIAIFPIPFFWFLVHPAIGFWRRVGTRPYLIALPVWGGLGMLLVAEPQWVFAGRVPRSAWMWAVGAGLFFFGIWLELQKAHLQPPSPARRPGTEPRPFRRHAHSLWGLRCPPSSLPRVHDDLVCLRCAYRLGGVFLAGISQRPLVSSGCTS